jgi:6,7-dimethyl-8-ribityllumazine synthase
MQEYHGHFVGTGLRIAIVVSRWNDIITQRLLEGALDGLKRHGVDTNTVRVARGRQKVRRQRTL